MTSQLEYVSDGDIITADRQNDITDYVERALYRTNTKYLMVGDIIVIDALRNAIVNGLTIGSLNGLLKASNGVVSTASANTDYLIDLSNFTTSNLIEGTNLYFTNARAQNALSSHTSDSSIHFTQGNISVTESQVSDLKNYFDKDVDTSDSVTDTATNRFTNDIDISRLANTSGTNTGDITVTDSAEIDFTLTGQDITASIKNGSIDETKLDTSVNDSLDLADSAIQTELDPVFSNSEAANITATDITNLSNLSGTNSGDQDLSGYQETDEKNQNNGYCGLDSGGKVPISNLPTTLLQYQGVWNANTNTPILTSPDITKIGFVYNVSVEGTQFGIDFSLGDWLIYNASGIPEKSDNSDDVTSVNSQTGTVVLDADDIDDTSTTNKFVTDTDITNLSNLSGTNTGDQDLSGLLKLDQSTPQTINGGMPTFSGGLLAGDKIKFTQTDGNEYIDSLADGFMDYGATTAHRFSGNVGIGTVNPTSPLHVVQTGAEDTIANFLNPHAGYSTIRLGESTTSAATFTWGNTEKTLYFQTNSNAYPFEFQGSSNVFDPKGAGGSIFKTNGTQRMSITSSGITISNAVNIVLNTSTGTKIGTATNQKLGFFNSSPVVQQTATTDLGTALSNLGLRASGTAYPITTSGAVTLTNAAIKLGSDASTLYFGAGNDASITYDGTNLIINPKVVGSGYLSVLGNINAAANDIYTTGAVKGVHKAADGTTAVADGTYTVGIGGTTNGTITIKDGIITAVQEAVA